MTTEFSPEGFCQTRAVRDEKGAWVAMHEVNSELLEPAKSYVEILANGQGNQRATELALNELKELFGV